MVTAPDIGSRNDASPWAACRNSASARNTWAARNSPAGVNARDRRSINLTPRLRSMSAMCLETAGWLMRNSSAAPENEPRRTNPRNARRRAPSSITTVYMNVGKYVFFSSEVRLYCLLASTTGGKEDEPQCDGRLRGHRRGRHAGQEPGGPGHAGTDRP